MVQRGYGETPASLITSKGSGQTSYTEARARNSTLTYKLGPAWDLMMALSSQTTARKLPLCQFLKCYESGRAHDTDYNLGEWLCPPPCTHFLTLGNCSNWSRTFQEEDACQEKHISAAQSLRITLRLLPPLAESWYEKLSSYCCLEYSVRGIFHGHQPVYGNPRWQGTAPYTHYLL